MSIVWKYDSHCQIVIIVMMHKKYWPEWEGETEVRAMLDPGDCARSAPELTSAANH